MGLDQIHSADFTNDAWELLYEVVDDDLFGEEDDPLLIYKDHPEDLYRRIIRDAFRENETPPSFTPTTAKLSALSKNWLNQQSVNRNVIFLLGFGLRMSVEDVNSFLTKALNEREINPKMPFEVICWYCYKHGFTFPKFQQLWKKYEELEAAHQTYHAIMREEEGTIGVRTYMQAIKDENGLLSYLAKLKTSHGTSYMSVSARKHFMALYDETRELIAKHYNEVPDKEGQHYSKEAISGGDIEKVILSAVPLDSNGNLSPAKKSALNRQFAGKRFSRQRMSDILNGVSEVTRFDLITLEFFIFSQNEDRFKNPQTRYAQYVDTINKILLDCCMGGLYITNPYECFVLMCLLSDDPLTTYADVWALSYEDNNG